jgi:hypothetical protein
MGRDWEPEDLIACWTLLETLFWSNINPYGEIRLDMTRRLGLTVAHD